MSVSPEERLAADGATIKTLPAHPGKQRKAAWRSNKPGKEFGRLRLLSVDDAYAAPSRKHLIYGLFAIGETSVMWGAPKSGKSFLMLRLAYGLSLGVGMWGRKAIKVPVAYVVAEGAGGFGGRIRAVADSLGRSPDFHYIAQRVDLFDRNADLAHLIAAIQSIGARFVVVDTLARTMGAGNESSAQDMGIYVANCDRIREETGAHVAIVHHGGWDNGHLRGSTALLGAVDLVMKVEGKRDEPRRLVIDDAKDDAAGDAFGFSLSSVDLPPDVSGNARSTLIAIESEAETARGDGDAKGKGKLPDRAALLLRVIENVDPALQVKTRPIPKGPTCRCLKRSDLRSALITDGWFPEHLLFSGDEPQKANPAAEDLLFGEGRSQKATRAGLTTENNALTALKRRNIIGFNSDWVWLI